MDEAKMNTAAVTPVEAVATAAAAAAAVVDWRMLAKLDGSD